MTPEKYNKVKEIFLSACEKPREEQSQFIQKSCEGDEEIRREVESLLKEHRREVQVMPSDPENPLGSMSAILSRANLDIAAERAGTLQPEAAQRPAGGAGGGGGPAGHDAGHEGTRYLEESGDLSSSSISGIVDAGRFMAGTVVAGRYRIIELLGRGGMGEVYRADDITLSQSVALKFLPAIFSADQKWLERFRNEVRLARQVTHPNVCRVFDIDEFQGEQFISMEYIDGENLGSLLRRIGRLPQDKAVQIARQLCAGLAAAHDRGVLHRDLKPANVMIDGRGYVRITDFGLAAPVDQMRADGGGGAGGPVRAGTPAYMSPEQLLGKPVTVRSDVYSLGLVLYEMFTGRRTFRAESLRDYQKLHSSEDPTPPSEIIDEIDPIVERVIMRCLEKDPRDRPASAMAVSAALPGGNPLREILAAGETPTPAVVAAAGEMQGAMRPRIAITLLAVALASLFVFVYYAPRVFIVQRAVRESDSPAVMAYKARNILKDLGYTDIPKDSAEAFAVNHAYYLSVQANIGERDRMRLLWRPRPGLIYFWYRQSPENLIPLQPDTAVTVTDPAPLQPGMVEVRLDPLGRLIGLRAEPANTPPAIAATGPSATASATMEAGWVAQVRRAADMETGTFKAVDPVDDPPVYADERAAWDGSFADASSVPVHIEAAAVHGRVVYFAVMGQSMPERMSEELATRQAIGVSNQAIQTAVIIALLIAGTWLAWRNYRSGRGDRQGANRMALAFFLLGLIAWLFRAHHIMDLIAEFQLFQRGMGPVLYLVCLVWIFYMALEPYVRRVWPEAVISWSRLLAGRWFDPVVGRDVLVGAAMGVTTMILTLCEYELPHWLGVRAPLPSVTSATAVLGATSNPSTLFNGGISAIYFGLILLLFLVLVRMATRRLWVAGTAFVLLFATATAHYSVGQPFLRTENVLSWGVQALIALLFLGVMMRHGLVAIIFCILVRGFMADFPVTWELNVWYASSSLVGIGAAMAVIGAGFYAALGGRTLMSPRMGETG